MEAQRRFSSRLGQGRSPRTPLPVLAQHTVTVSSVHLHLGVQPFPRLRMQGDRRWRDQYASQLMESGLGRVELNPQKSYGAALAPRTSEGDLIGNTVVADVIP